MDNIIGKKQGKLTVLTRLEGSRVVCKCECGNHKTVLVGHFNTGNYKSCGCHVIRHGHCSSTKGITREYASYYNMIARCHNRSNKRYNDYGERGIRVSDSWRESFVNFLADMGRCPDGFTIDRIDNDEGYSKNNCRWVSRSDNQRNRRNSRWYYVHGKRFGSAKEAGDEYNVSGSTIRAWCSGRYAEGRYYPPKNGCSRLRKYSNETL